MSRSSGGIVLYRRLDGNVEVLLGHMGGPFWARKDAGAWSIPKGEIDGDDDPFTVACREFEEETGTPIADAAPIGAFADLGDIRQKSGKTVHAWAIEGDLDPVTQSSNTFEMEWPPRSGVMAEFPEIDRVGWFDLETARAKVIAGQRTLIDRLAALLGLSPDSPDT